MRRNVDKLIGKYRHRDAGTITGFRALASTAVGKGEPISKAVERERASRPPSGQYRDIIKKMHTKLQEQNAKLQEQRQINEVFTQRLENLETVVAPGADAAVTRQPLLSRKLDPSRSRARPIARDVMDEYSSKRGEYYERVFAKKSGNR